MLIKAPTTRPTMIAQNTPILVTTTPRAESVQVIVSGSIHCTITNEAIAVRTILDQLPKFNAFCTLPNSSFTRTNIIPMIEKTIPKPAINIGNKIGAIPPKLSFEINSLPKTIVAKIVATYEPNKSAPIPATSPTLSPTLSAIVAGLRTSSSGIPASTFPTKSAPTSAALV